MDAWMRREDGRQPTIRILHSVTSLRKWKKGKKKEKTAKEDEEDGEETQPGKTQLIKTSALPILGAGNERPIAAPFISLSP